MARPKKPTPSTMMPDSGMAKKVPAKAQAAPPRKPVGIRGIKGKTVAR